MTKAASPKERISCWPGNVMRSSPKFPVHNQRGFQNIKKEQTNINKAIIHEYQYKITTRGRTRQATVLNSFPAPHQPHWPWVCWRWDFWFPAPRLQTALSMADTNFILAAAQGGMTEVKLGELASPAACGRCQVVRPDDGEGSHGHQ